MVYAVGRDWPSRSIPAVVVTSIFIPTFHHVMKTDDIALSPVSLRQRGRIPIFFDFACGCGVGLRDWDRRVLAAGMVVVAGMSGMWMVVLREGNVRVLRLGGLWKKQGMRKPIHDQRLRAAKK